MKNKIAFMTLIISASLTAAFDTAYAIFISVELSSYYSGLTLLSAAFYAMSITAIVLNCALAVLTAVYVYLKKQ